MVLVLALVGAGLIQFAYLVWTRERSAYLDYFGQTKRTVRIRPDHAMAALSLLMGVVAIISCVLLL